MRTKGTIYFQKEKRPGKGLGSWRGQIARGARGNKKVFDFYGKTQEIVREKMDQFLAKESVDEATTQRESDEHTENTWTLSRNTSESIRTLDELIRVCKIDVTAWEVERWVCNKWDMLQAGVGPTPLFQVKAWLRRKTQIILVRDEIEEIKKDAIIATKKLVGKSISPPRQQRKNSSGLCLELSLTDHHFGKLCWPKETGWEPYDTEHAEVEYDRAVDSLVTRTSPYQFDRIVFVVGNDILHIDNRSLRTESGTQLDTDSRYHQIFRTARACVQRSVEKLRAVAPVEVIVVPGNHDYHSSWHLGDSLEVAFSQHKDVTVDCAPRARKYFEWGFTGLMWTHGHKSKRRGAELPLIFAAEEPGIWGRTKFREVHLGHFHHTRAEEIHGCVVRILPSLTSTDMWHSENEYVGAIRRSEAFIWSKEEGLVGTAIHSIRRDYT